MRPQRFLNLIASLCSRHDFILHERIYENFQQAILQKLVPSKFEHTSQRPIVIPIFKRGSSHYVILLQKGKSQDSLVFLIFNRSEDSKDVEQKFNSAVIGGNKKLSDYFKDKQIEKKDGAELEEKNKRFLEQEKTIQRQRMEIDKNLDYIASLEAKLLQELKNSSRLSADMMAMMRLNQQIRDDFKEEFEKVASKVRRDYPKYYLDIFIKYLSIGV